MWEIQDLLLLAGADVNTIDMFGRNPLHYRNDSEVARVLVRCGGDIGVKDKEGMTPLSLKQMDGWYLPDDLKAVLECKDTGTTKFDGP